MLTYAQAGQAVGLLAFLSYAVIHLNFKVFRNSGGVS